MSGRCGHHSMALSTTCAETNRWTASSCRCSRPWKPGRLRYPASGGTGAQPARGGSEAQLQWYIGAVLQRGCLRRTSTESGDRSGSTRIQVDTAGGRNQRPIAEGPSFGCTDCSESVRAIGTSFVSPRLPPAASELRLTGSDREVEGERGSQRDCGVSHSSNKPVSCERICQGCEENQDQEQDHRSVAAPTGQQFIADGALAADVLARAGEAALLPFPTRVLVAGPLPQPAPAT